jgi:hypothetical protein
MLAQPAGVRPTFVRLRIIQWEMKSRVEGLVEGFSHT